LFARSCEGRAREWGTKMSCESLREDRRENRTWRNQFRDHVWIELFTVWLICVVAAIMSVTGAVDILYYVSGTAAILVWIVVGQAGGGYIQ